MPTNKRPPRKTSAIIRIRPFQMDVKITRQGFQLQFRGLTTNNQVIEAHLEFPAWWIGPMQDKVGAVVRRGRKGR